MGNRYNWSQHWAKQIGLLADEEVAVLRTSFMDPGATTNGALLAISQ
jgi:hypothetical protein